MSQFANIQLNKEGSKEIIYPVDNTVHTLPSTVSDLLRSVESTGAYFAAEFIAAPAARLDYNMRLKKLLKVVEERAKAGTIPMKDVAEFANNQRNFFMNEIRKKTLPGVRSYTEKQKPKGLILTDLQEKYAIRKIHPTLNPQDLDVWVKGIAEGRHKSVFHTLSQEAKNEVYYTVAKSATKSNTSANNKAWGILGLGGLATAITVLSVMYAIDGAPKEERLNVGFREVTVAGAGIAGGAIGGAAASGLFCGPGAPFCVFVFASAAAILSGLAAGKMVEDVSPQEWEWVKIWLS